MACSEMHLYFAASAEVQSWGERAKREAQRALEEDANVAETHQALAAVYGRTEFDWPRTISESTRALELNPSLDLSHYVRGRAFYHLGMFEEATRDVQEGLKINPNAYERSENLAEAFRTSGNTALLQGRFAEAVAALEEAQRGSAGAVSDWWLAQAYYYQGQKERSIQLLEKLTSSTSASAAARSRAILASILAADGQRGRANEIIREVQSGDYMDHHVAYSLGLAFAQLNEREKAVEWIRKAAETGFPCYPWFERDPMLEPLRNDSNFKSFMTQLRSTFQTTKAKYASLTY
jgi:tetratricopeptide (TPR) repeat protein